MARCLHALACAALVAAPLGARAAGCSSLTASGLAFGAYSPFATAPLDAAGTVSFRCPGVASVSITVSRGASGNRTLASGADRLAYEVYLDAARTQVWGDLSGGSYPTFAGGGQSQTATLYGRVFAQQDVATGQYADTLTVTFHF